MYIIVDATEMNNYCGVGFAVNKRVADSERRVYAILRLYAPTQESFYEILEQRMNKF